MSSLFLEEKGPKQGLAGGNHGARRTRHRSGHAERASQQAGQHLPRNGHRDDEDLLLDHLQRGSRLLVRDLQPQRRHDRAGGVLPSPARGNPLHHQVGHRGVRAGELRAGRRRYSQRPVPRRLPHAGARRDQGRLPRRRDLRLRCEHRTRRRDRRHGAGIVRRHRHRGLPGGTAPSAGQNHAPGRVCQRCLEGDPHQPPHSFPYLGRTSTP